MLQKRICRDLKRNPVTIACDRYIRDIAMGCICPAARCSERRKVMLPSEVLSGFVHALGVKRLVNPPGAMPVQR